MSIAWHDVVGMVGVGAMLLAYALLQMERVRGDTLAYQLLNLFGALAVLVSLLQDFNLSAFVIETAWVVISAWGILRVRRRRAQASPPL